MTMSIDYEGGDKRQRETEGADLKLLSRPFFSGPVWTVGSGMGSKTLQSFPV